MLYAVALCALHWPGLLQATNADDRATALPGRYFRLLAAELAVVEQRLAAQPNADLKQLETRPEMRHFPGTILAAAVLFAIPHPANPKHGDRKYLSLAVRM